LGRASTDADRPGSSHVVQSSQLTTDVTARVSPSR
jgi:hypothetical protein